MGSEGSVCRMSSRQPYFSQHLQLFCCLHQRTLHRPLLQMHEFMQRRDKPWRGQTKVNSATTHNKVTLCSFICLPLHTHNIHMPNRGWSLFSAKVGTSRQAQLVQGAHSPRMTTLDTFVDVGTRCTILKPWDGWDESGWRLPRMSWKRAGNSSWTRWLWGFEALSHYIMKIIVMSPTGWKAKGKWSKCLLCTAGSAFKAR